MSMNWKEIDLILEELELQNDFIRDIFQPDYATLVFECYGRKGPRFILVSLGQNATRIHEISRPPEKKAKVQRFVQLLRAHFKGGRIVASGQINRDRIVALQIKISTETKYLFIRLWSNASNIIAADSGFRILDAYYRRPGRKEVSGEIYNPYEMKTGQRKEFEYTIREYDVSMSFSRALEMEYSTRGEEKKLHELLRKAGKKYLEKRNILETRIRELENLRNASQQGNTYKLWGDIILANAYAINPGMIWLETINHVNGLPVSIELDPGKTPQENAEACYARYREAKKELRKIEDEISARKTALSKVLETYDEIVRTQDPAKLAVFTADRKKRSTKPAGLPGLRFMSGSFEIIVGRSAKENDELMRRHVRGNDIWVHNRYYPGSYVFIKCKPGKSVPLDVLLDAANLSLHFSKSRNSGKGDLYYTQVKYLRRVKNGKTGLVIPTQEKNLSVSIDNARIDRLMKHEEDDGPV